MLNIQHYNMIYTQSHTNHVIFDIMLYTIIQLYWSKRRIDYFLHRCPSWVTIFNVYCCISMIIICTQELVISLGYNYPCILLWIINACNICLLSLPATIRGWSVAVRFTPKLRQTAARLLLTKLGQQKLYIKFGSICAVFYIAMLFAWPYYTSPSGNRLCSINGEFYFYIPYALYALNRAKKLKTCMSGVDDYYDIGHEIRVGFSMQSFLLFYYVLEMILFILPYTTVPWTRQDIEYYGVPFDYLIYVLYSIRIHATSTKPLYNYPLWFNKHYGDKFITRVNSFTNEPSITTTISITNTANNAILKESYRVKHNTSVAESYIVNTNRVSPVDDRDHNKSHNLLTVLNDDTMRAEFTIHACKSLCSEMMIFYNEIHTFRHNDSKNDNIDWKQRKDFLLTIYTKYVAVDSDYELNVSDGIRQRFCKAVDTLSFDDNTIDISYLSDSYDLLNILQKEIYNLMRTNLYRTFTNTQVYNTYIQNKLNNTKLHNINNNTQLQSIKNKQNELTIDIN